MCPSKSRHDSIPPSIMHGFLKQTQSISQQQLSWRRLSAILATWLCFAATTLLAHTNSIAQQFNDDKPEIDSPKVFSPKDIEFFEVKIRPILVEHCYECHSGKELNGGLSVESRPQLLSGGDSGGAILLGPNHKDSPLLKAVSYQHENLQMPPKGRLNDQQLEWLRQWIELDAPDPRESTAGAKQSHPVMGMSLEAGKQFWSFRPVSAPKIPEVNNPQWPQSPIDNFILSNLESKQIAPAPLADKRTLIRRVTLDLTGLPPTVDEVEQFVADLSPNAYRDLIERLLASPQYGVRWGRHWLDVARYADSNGLDENIAYGNAWRYRDYVINSWNNDKPFNLFVQEQIAGDLLPHASDETRTATGFLALGAKVLAEPDVEKLTMDTIDEQIDTLGKTFLGLSLGCARCHDHKFDPITQGDYYALAAIFKGTRTFADERFGAIKYWYEHALNDPNPSEVLKAVEAEIAAAKQAAAKYKSDAYEKIRQTSRAKAADYLAAASPLPVGASLVQVAEVAKPLDLHPRILHYCRTHIENQREAFFYQTWHRLAAQPDELKSHYTQLFARVDAALEEAKKADPKATTLSDPELEEARKERSDPAAFLSIPPQPEYALDDATLAEYYQLMEKARVIESGAIDRATAMGVCDAAAVPSLPIHIRGSHLNLGQLTPRNFPTVLLTSTVEPIFSDHSSGRLELANWLTSTDNPLTARVIVNRVWGWHFGNALVQSTENFGVQGDAPSNVEMLDWLARRFMQSGWSLKELHRIILNSSAYQMASLHPDSSKTEQLDPANRLLWKFPIHRLDAEQLRDSVLAVSGRLDCHLTGKTVPLRNRQFVFDHTSIDHTRYESLRRTAYLPIIRNNLYTLLEQFDFPDPTMPTGRRSQTTVAPQSLLLMNNSLVMDSASELAGILIAKYDRADQRLNELFLRLMARPPTRGEMGKCLDFVAQSIESGRLDATQVSKEVELQVWATVVQAAMASNDFLNVK